VGLNPVEPHVLDIEIVEPRAPTGSGPLGSTRAGAARVLSDCG
jgi:hypothetical protein